MFQLNAEYTGQPIEQIEADSDRDRWFTAQEAMEYGFVDHIITRAVPTSSSPTKKPNVSEHGLRSPQSALLTPQARYILPSFVEHTWFGIKETNPYNKLFEERIIFLGVQIDDASANDVMAQLLTLEAIDPDRDITMYINSPGGSMTSMMAIYDTMQYVQPDIQTVLLGPGRLGGGGAAGRGDQGQADGAAQRADPDPPACRWRAATASSPTWRSRPARSCGCVRPWSTLAQHTGQDEEKIRNDTERDKILTAEEAKEYGIIDDVLTMIKRGSERAAEVVSSLAGRIQLFPPGPSNGFDGVHRDPVGVPSICKRLMASRDMSAGGGRFGRRGGTR